VNDTPFGPEQHQGRLGVVVGGSLTDGIDVRLDAGRSTEDVKVGTFVGIQGDRSRFLGVVTDVSLEATDPTLKANPPDMSDPYVAGVVSGTAAYGIVKVEPMLVIDVEGHQPAKTVPGHFATVSTASEEDIQMVFGSEDDRHFWIGSPLDMETRLCLDIQELVKRSNGVFGKSGTGKTFLTRLLLAGILQSGEATNLVFDMESEYGWQGYSEANIAVKGLKQLFSSKVAVFSLDEESSKRRGLTPDYIVRIGYEEIEPEDIEILRELLNLSDVAADAAHFLRQHFGAKSWLREFLALRGREEVRAVADAMNVNPGALLTLQNRLSRLGRFAFMDENSRHDSVDHILTYLDRGYHVVLEFGRYGRDTAAYVLVANLLTRRIYRRYVERKERASTGGEEPRPLVITIEEAHKFLTPSVAGQTIFGTIAREMRKYNVTLLIVDQRPSGIDQEVLSQLGTKFTCLLDSEPDIDAVLRGVSGSRKLRSVLARLESKQQALIFGHALPMPVVVRTRDYGTADSYRELGFRDAVELKAKVERDVQDLFGPPEQ
jgi:DNA helicase HerA-like ATPase